TLPDYIKFATVRESAITLETPWKTPGILTLPASPGQYPAVILVHDLGPKDRDETTGANKPFRDLAWGLGSQGIAVIRYDKRTLLNDPNINPPLGDYTVQQEFIDDIQAAVTWLKTHASIRSDQIFIVGHGLGGTLIPRIEKNYPQLAGGIIMAGFTQSLTDVISRENNYLNAFDKEISPIEKAEQNKLDLKIAKVIAPELSSAIESAELPLGLSAEYWLDMRVYNPITLAKESKKPLLILQGGRDYQVTLDDFYGWRKNLIQRENTAFKLYLHLNHLFMEGYGKGVRSHPDEYNLRGHLAPVVIDDISQWIHQCVKGIR
ncbi:MAG: alpha/beta hydrolase, partial [Phycisphaerae bacterium]|nr:alpha/beta hydrolase [Phycisphaerae bacterium]